MWSILIIDFRHHENVHEVILSASDLDIFCLNNIANKGFFDVLMLSSTSAISQAIMTTDEIKCDIKAGC